MNDDLKNAQPGDVFRDSGGALYEVRPKIGRLGLFPLVRQTHERYPQGITRLVPERPLTKLQAGDVIPKGVRVLRRWRGTGSVETLFGGGWKITTDDCDYYLDPIPSLPPVEPEQPEKGLYRRYNVSKVDGNNDPSADYFVLRLDEHGDDKQHIEACRKAVMLYADEIESHLPQLSKDLREKYGKPLLGPTKSKKGYATWTDE